MRQVSPYISWLVGKEVLNYTYRNTNSVNYNKPALAAQNNQFIELIDFDYFDRFYTTFTQSRVAEGDWPSYIELFEVKSVNTYMY